MFAEGPASFDIHYNGPHPYPLHHVKFSLRILPPMPHPSRRDEFFAGVRAELPLLVGVAPFGLAFGAYAIDTGLSAGYSVLTSLVIFGGASQFAAARQIQDAVPAIIVIATIGLVNLRHMLYSASLAPHVDMLPARWRWLLAYLLTDEGYIVAVTRYEEPDDAPFRHWFVFGAMLALWACWQVTTAAGIALGASVPESWALEFALPLTFIAIIVPSLRDRPAIAAAGVAAAASILTHEWAYGTGLLAAVAAGIAAGMVGSRMAGEHGGREARA